jgi:hypothetical protein
MGNIGTAWLVAPSILFSPPCPAQWVIRRASAGPV